MKLPRDCSGALNAILRAVAQAKGVEKTDILDHL